MSEQRPETLLVVDDNPATLYSTARFLRGAGFHVVEAMTGLDAVASSQKRVDLVVLDVNLPDIDGFEVCRRIRSHPATARLPVIHLSATFVQDTDKVHGLEAGADGYLTHPVEPPVLVATVNAFLRTRQAEDALRRSEARFKAVFENALHGIALIGQDQVYLDVNPAMCRLLGLPAAAIVGRHTSDFIPPDRKAEAAAAEAALRAGGAWRGNLPLVRSDGRIVQLEWSISFHSLPGVRLAIVNDVTDRLAIEREREQLLVSERAARSEAERATTMRDEFLAVVSHELRTPLTAILLWSKLLLGGSINRDELPEVFETIRRSAESQQQLIEDLLDLSRMMSGKLRLDMREARLAPVVEAAVDAARPMADARGVRIDASLDEGAGRVRVDPDRIQQVIWNLLNNAVKFTDRGGRVDVRLRRLDTHLRIEVADTGRGISADFLPFVFDRFRQADASTTRTQGGLGLGLAISRQLVELQGGTIRAESAGLGKGAVFTVDLSTSGVPPEAAPDSRTPADAADTQVFVPTPILKGMRLLVVEDDASTRTAIRWLLERCEANVTAVESAAQALAAFEGGLDDAPFDVVISDIGLPIQDGYELLGQIREMENQRGRPALTPAVALTAYSRAEDRAKALAAGYRSHLAKPIEPGALVEAVAALSGRPAAPPLDPVR